MTAGDFRLLARQFAGSVESAHMRHPDFRRKGRVFATLDYPGPGWAMVKLTPTQQQRFVRRAPKVFQPASGAWGKAGSTTVRLERAQKAVVWSALSAAFGNLAPPRRTQLLRFPAAVRRDPAIAAWMGRQPAGLGAIAEHWFGVLRTRGPEVGELLHDGHPTACVGDAAFGYVNAFRAHVNVGFFRGAGLADPKGLLEGQGRFMRHVKLCPGGDVDAPALMKLITAAYRDMKMRVRAEARAGIGSSHGTIAQARRP
jgi:hypothetical protein